MNEPDSGTVTIVYSSMYGNSAKLIPQIEQVLIDEGVNVVKFQVPQDHASFVLSSAWISKGIVFAMPTYEYKMFPPMFQILDILERSHVNKRKVMRVGSYGWSGGAQKQFDPFIETLKWNCLGNVEYQGAPTDKDKENAIAIAKELAKSVLN
jgi:flavorubredoxin